MNIFCIILFFAAVIGVLVFVCFFWYSFGIHDFGQNEWEEKELKRGKIIEKEDKHKEKRKKVDKNTRVNKHIENKIKTGAKNKGYGSVNDKPLSEEKIGVDKKEYKKGDEETYKESDSGVGSESPNLISTISFDDNDVRIDNLFLCRTKSAFSRISFIASLDCAREKKSDGDSMAGGSEG